MKAMKAVAAGLVALVVAAILYAISTGPAAYLWHRGYITEDSFNAYVAPLCWCVRGKASGYVAGYWVWWMDWAPD